ncbi:MAG TPA: DoxX family protein [Actinocatenispora sp.]
MDQTTPSAPPRPAWQRTLWVLQAIAAIGFAAAAAGKLSGSPEVVATFRAIGFPDCFRYLLAALELAGAVALLVPRLVGLAGVAFVALTVGATVTQLATGASPVMPLLMLVLSAAIAGGRRASIARLRADLTRRPRTAADTPSARPRT